MNGPALPNKPSLVSTGRSVRPNCQVCGKPADVRTDAPAHGKHNIRCAKCFIVDQKVQAPTHDLKRMKM
jgi:hypothetical protein